MGAVGTGPALRASEVTVRQDWPRLAAYLAQSDMTLETEPEARQFAGGLANLNYLIRIDDRETVLRRPLWDRYRPAPTTWDASPGSCGACTSDFRWRRAHCICAWMRT
jgi:hypothetical protein